MCNCCSFFWHLERHLSNCLNKWLTFNISNSSANFNNGNICSFSSILDSRFNFICDVRNNLNRTSKVIPFSFSLNYRLINFSSSKIIFFASLKSYKPFIMAEIKICFSAIIGDKDFSMLERTHCSWINIDVWIYFY